MEHIFKQVFIHRKRINNSLDRLRILLPHQSNMKKDMASLLEQAVEYVNVMHRVLNDASIVEKSLCKQVNWKHSVCKIYKFFITLSYLKLYFLKTCKLRYIKNFNFFKPQVSFHAVLKKSNENCLSNGCCNVILLLDQRNFLKSFVLLLILF